MWEFFGIFSLAWFVKYLAVLNIVTLVLFMIDRFSSLQGGMRFPKSVFWTAILIGGAPAAWVGIKAFKHGTFDSSMKWGSSICMVFYLCIILSFYGS